ncbi:MAG: hypothetical protein KGJ60_07450 [Verrucomicrobiota bacterium]|nr:hypothetical protein [Verrucomicrobiota bacterium]
MISGIKFAPRLLILIGCALALPACGEKAWVSPVTGFWRDGTNWSGNTPPDSTAFIQITNANTKTVIIDALTPATNLTAQMLTLNAPPGQTNALLLDSAGTNNPLILQTGLTLQDGAVLRITNSALVLQLTNDHVNIDGSLVLDSGYMDFGDVTVTARVGRVTSGTFTINSGLVSVGTLTVGGLTNSSGALNLNGGILNVASLLSVGRNPGTTGTASVLGGQLRVPNDDTRIGDSGLGQLTVSNATALLTNLVVGHDPSASGTLVVQNNGLILTSNDVSIARLDGSTGTVFVLGGQLQALGQTIHVGQEGSGAMILSNGTVQAAQVLVAADDTNTASGRLTVAGGALVLSWDLAVGSALGSTGQVVLSGGSITVGNLVLTNSTGQFLFSGGTLTTAGTTVANGAPFVVGDGLAPALLYLNGGTHTFANGLVISSNATLAGCGAIVGTLVNHGTVIPCGTPVPSQIAGFVRSGATNTISFPTVVGQTYTLEFRNALTDASWTPLVPPTNGNGSLMTLQDLSATGAARFYHLRIQ